MTFSQTSNSNINLNGKLHLGRHFFTRIKNDNMLLKMNPDNFSTLIGMVNDINPTNITTL